MEIVSCLCFVRPGNGFSVRFTLSAKYDVNGKHEHPLFTFLKVPSFIGPVHELNVILLTAEVV